MVKTWFQPRNCLFWPVRLSLKMLFVGSMDTHVTVYLDFACLLKFELHGLPGWLYVHDPSQSLHENEVGITCFVLFI